jgi:cysteine synthase A
MLPPFKRERLIYHIIYPNALQVRSTNDTTKCRKKQYFWQNPVSSLHQKLFLDMKQCMQFDKIAIPGHHMLKRTGKCAIIYPIFFREGSLMAGNTPLVALDRMQREHGWQARVLVKCEWCNPAGSSKDRAVLYMLDEAFASGRLAAGGTVVEPTSGNTGIALAAQASARGLHAVIVMPDNMSAERILLMRARGANVILTPAALGMQGAIDEAERIVAGTPGAIMLGQFENPANALAHYKTTGPEILAQTGGELDCLIACVGTGGTLSGTGKYLKEQLPHLRVIAVEPAESPLLSKGYSGAHGIQGIGANFVPEVLDRGVIDEILTVSTEQAKQTCCALGRTEGLLVGISSGAAVAAADEIARRAEMCGKKIAVILPDGGERYLSTGIYD